MYGRENVKRDLIISLIMLVLLFALANFLGVAIVDVLTTKKLQINYDVMYIASKFNVEPYRKIIINMFLVLLLGYFYLFFQIYFGSKVSRKDRGSKWSTKNQIKKTLKYTDLKKDDNRYAGLPFISNGKYAYVDNENNHTLVVGTTSSGKTRRFILPLITILSKTIKSKKSVKESMVILDPKGEIYEKSATYLKEKGYDIKVINLRKPKFSDGYNPLKYPYELYKQGNVDEAYQLLSDLSQNLMMDENDEEKFFSGSASNYFAGLCALLFDIKNNDEEINISSVLSMIADGEKDVSKGNEKLLINEYVEKLKQAKKIDKNGFAHRNMGGTLIATDRTRSSITAVLSQKLGLFNTSPSLVDMLSKQDYDYTNIGKTPTVLYIIVHDEKKTFHPIVTLFLKQLYEMLIDLASQQKGQELPVRVNFLIDEFANMPSMKDFDSMMTASRSRRIRFFLIIQSYAQLDKVYGREIAEIIKSNAQNLVYLLSREEKVLDEIVKLTGKKKMWDKRFQRWDEEPLITHEELQTFKFGDTLFLKLREFPFKSKLKDISKYIDHEMFKPTEHSLKPRSTFPIFDLEEAYKTIAFNKKKDGKKEEPIIKKQSTNKIINDVVIKLASKKQKEREEDLIKTWQAKWKLTKRMAAKQVKANES